MRISDQSNSSALNWKEDPKIKSSSNTCSKWLSYFGFIADEDQASNARKIEKMPLGCIKNVLVGYFFNCPVLYIFPGLRLNLKLIIVLKSKSN